jgi:hypothetical protein
MLRRQWLRLRRRNAGMQLVNANRRAQPSAATVLDEGGGARTRDQQSGVPLLLAANEVGNPIPIMRDAKDLRLGPTSLDEPPAHKFLESTF